MSGHCIQYVLDQAKDEDSHSTPTEVDYESYSALESSIASQMADFCCPSCGSHSVNGSGVIVRYGKVDFYREESYTGWFGGTCYRDVFEKTLWRVHEIGLKPGHDWAFLVPSIEPGRLKCEAKGCGWTDEAPIYPAQTLSETLGIKWYTIRETMQGKMWRE